MPLTQGMIYLKSHRERQVPDLLRNLRCFTSLSNRRGQSPVELMGHGGHFLPHSIRVDDLLMMCTKSKTGLSLCPIICLIFV